LRERVAQTIVEDEGVKGFRCGLAKPKVQPNLSKTINLILLQFGPFDAVQRVGEISSGWLFCLRDLSHTYSYTCFIFNKETKQKEKETSKGSTGLNTEEPKFIINLLISFLFLFNFLVRKLF
jgi:hypothetical protein